MIYSIRWRLVASYVLLTLLSVSIVGVLASEIVHRYIQEQEVQELKANAQSLAQQLLPLMWVNAPRQQIHSLTQAASFLGDVRVRVLDHEGHMLADSGLPGISEELLLIYPPEGSDGFPFQNEAWFNLVMPVTDDPFPFKGFNPSMLEHLPSDTTFQFVQRATGPWGGRISFGVPITREGRQRAQPPAEEIDKSRSTSMITESIGDSRNPLGYVELSAGQDFGAAALETTRRAFTLAGAGTILLAVIVGLVMSQRLTSQLRSLQETAGLMGSGDLSARASITRRDEIGDLAAQFNHMADQLQDSFTQLQDERDALRSFITDASHELRTPVTALKNFLTLIQGPAAKDPAAQSEFLSESQIQVERLERITSNLLDLTRLDAGLVELNLDNHDLGDLINSSATTFNSIAKDKQITLKILPIEKPISLVCDAPRMEMILSNLLDNALKFTPSGSEILIGAEETPDQIRLWVQDTGAGIPQDELPNIFDRFYRGRHHISAGSGLGLAIVKSLVEAQGGHIQVESTFGEGSIFTIQFPNTE